MPKIDYKNWKYGDTFYLQLPKELEMDYSYIIIYSVSEDRTKKKIVYIKLTNEMPEKVDEEYLNNCEFLCTSTTLYEDRFWPIEYGKTVDETIEMKSKIDYYPDEYGNLYIYIARIWFNSIKNSLLQSLVYLGNFKLRLPKEEFIPWHETSFPTYYLDCPDSSNYSNINEFVNSVRNQYYSYNLKESKVFNMEHSKKVRKMAKDAFEYSYVVEERVKQYIANGYKE